MAFDYVAYNAKYKKEKYDQIAFRVPKGDKEKIAAAAERRGLSLNKYIVSLIEADIDKLLKNE